MNLIQESPIAKPQMPTQVNLLALQEDLTHENHSLRQGLQPPSPLASEAQLLEP